MENENPEVAKLMRTLGISRAEAEELVAYDEMIERHEKTEYDLTEEQEKVAKQYINSNSYSAHKKKTPRKIENVDREIVMTKLLDALEEFENTQVTIPSRQIDFSYNGEDYYVSLMKKRPETKKKKKKMKEAE